MATLPIETIEVTSLPDPEQHNRGLVWMRGELFYAYNGRWYKFLIRQPLSIIPKGYIHGDLFSLNAMVFSTETVQILIRTDHSDGMAAFNSDTRGYFCGGRLYPQSKNTIRRIVFSCEVFEELIQRLSYDRLFACGLNSLSSGYTAGGSSRTDTEKLTFQTETVDLISTNISHATYSCDLNTINKGYLCGGTSITSLTYSNYATFLLATTIPSSVSLASGFSSVDVGFICGGSSSSRNIYSLEFWAEVVQQETISLATPRQGSGSFNNAIIGYSAGGDDGSYFRSSSICCFNMLDKYSHVLTQAILSERCANVSGLQSGGFL